MLEQNGTNDSDPKYTSEQVEERPVAARPGFGQKVKRHCARFWWLHLIIFCVIFLIVALCLVYVGMPKIAQHGVDQASLEFTELKFLDPTPDSIMLTQKGILNSPSQFTPTLDPFNASLYVVTNGTVAAERIMYITLPSIHALHPTSEVVLDNQKVLIENVAQLTDFATQVLKNEYVETSLQGKTDLHIGALPVVSVDYDSTSRYKGLNGLAGFNVTGSIINLQAAPGTPNLRGFAYIPNPSVMTIAMGNVTLTLSTAKEGIVGTATINNMTLAPGNNTFPMTGIVEQPKIISSMDLKTGFLDLFITGKDAIYNGEHLIYYEKALASNNLTLHMNVKQVLADSAAAANKTGST